MRIVHGLVAGAVLAVAGCTTPAPTLPYPPGLQSFIVDGAMATLVASACPELTRNEDAVNARLDVILESALSAGYTPSDMDYFLKHTDTDQVAALVVERFDQAGLAVQGSSGAAQTAASRDDICSYGQTETSNSTPVGKLLL